MHAHSMIVGLLTMVSMVAGYCLAETVPQHHEDEGDFTASSTPIPDASGIVSFGISTLFSEAGLRAWCQGTLVRKVQRLHDCDYTLVTAAHCLINDEMNRQKLISRNLASDVEIGRFGNIKAAWIEVHPDWLRRKGDARITKGTDLGFIQFIGRCSAGDTPVVPLWNKQLSGKEQLVVASINQQRLVPMDARTSSGRLAPVILLASKDPNTWARHGDSGGGCFVHERGRYYLAGVLSGGRDALSVCSSPQALNWLQQAIPNP